LSPSVWLRREETPQTCSLCRRVDARALVCVKATELGHFLGFCPGCVARLDRVARSLDRPTPTELATRAP
jgi:hypothetical protein